MTTTKTTLIAIACLAVTAHAQQPASAATADREQAQQILKETGVTGGLVVHVGCGDGKLAVALRTGPGLLVQGLDLDAGAIQRARALAAPKQIVFVHGKSSHGYGNHAYGPAFQMLARMLNENVSGVRAVVLTDDADLAALDTADVIMLGSDAGGLV